MFLRNKWTILEKTFICSLIMLHLTLILPLSEVFPLPKRVNRVEAFAEGPQNRAPVLDPIGDKSVKEGDLLEFTVTASDPDGDPLAYLAYNLPKGATFNPTTQVFSWRPTYLQSVVSYQNVHFEVTDGEILSGGIDENTKLLLHCDGENGSKVIEDSSDARHIVAVNGDAVLSTTQKEWGSASLLLDGAGDHLSIPDSADWDICGSASDDWTIDLWVRHANLPSGATEVYLCQMEDWNNRWTLGHQDVSGRGVGFLFVSNGDAKIHWDTFAGGRITDSGWHHIALCKVANKWGIYVDGNQVAYAVTDATDTFTAPSLIGKDLGGVEMNGYLDEIRIQHSNYFNAAPDINNTNKIQPPTKEYSRYGGCTGLTDFEDITIIVTDVNAPPTVSITPHYSSIIASTSTSFTLTIDVDDIDGEMLSCEVKRDDSINSVDSRNVSPPSIYTVTDNLPGTGIYKYTVTVTDPRGKAATDSCLVEVIPAGAPGDTLPISGDFNGDGLTDIGTWDQANNIWTIAFSGGDTFNDIRTWSNIFSNFNYYKKDQVYQVYPVIGDFDGDGKADIALYNRGTDESTLINDGNESNDIKGGTWVFAVSDGTNFIYKNSWDITEFGGGAFSPLVGDFNGDGMTDIGCAVSDPNLPSHNGRFWIKLAKKDKTTGAFEKEAITNETNVDASSTYSGDFNGDGLPDILAFKQDTGDWEVMLGQDVQSSQLVDWVQNPARAGDTIFEVASGSTFGSHASTFDGDFSQGAGGYFKAKGGYVTVAITTYFTFPQPVNITKVISKCETHGGGDRGGSEKRKVYLYYNGAWQEIVAEAANNIIVTTEGSWSEVTGVKLYSERYSSGSGDFDSRAVNFELQAWGPSAMVESNDSLSAFTGSADWILSIPNGFGTNKKPVITDYNHDGKTDIGYFDEATDEWHYAKSDGTQFTEISGAGWPTGPDFIGDANTLPSGGDYNGDGIGDAAIFHMDRKGVLNKWEIKLHSSKQPDLLVSVDNGIGGTTDIVYDVSTHYDNTGGDGNANTQDLPFPVSVVTKVTKTDGMGNSYEINYEYRDGYFKPDSREFRGFGYVKVKDFEGTIKETWFNQGDVLKGKPAKEEVTDTDGKKYSTVSYYWNDTNKAHGGLCDFPYLEAQENQFYSGGQPVKLTRAEYGTPDSYGNVMQIRELGEYNPVTHPDGDERTTYIDYVYNIADYIVNKPKTTYITNSSGQTVSQAWYYYDGSSLYDTSPIKGSLTKEEKWLSGSTNPTTQFTYDDYGNIRTVTDARGKVTSTTYDATSHTFPEIVQNALGHTQQFTYDRKTGQILTSTDPNGQTTQTIYDNFGRTWKVIGPNDTVDLPGIEYKYDLEYRTTSGKSDNPPVKITTETKIDESEKSIAYAFIDGLGRTIEVKTPAENSAEQIISGIVKFDSRGQVKEKYLPYFVNSPVGTEGNYIAPTYTQPKIIYEYDPIGRVTQTTNPDGKSSSVKYEGWTVTTTDEKGHEIKSEKDAYGRLIKVTEYNDENNDGTDEEYLTQYQYDALGNLKKTIDAQANETIITYDTLGRKIAMSDPDMGGFQGKSWTYQYDKVGNLISQTDAKGQILYFEYDDINRLREKGLSPKGTVPETEVHYEYDAVTAQNLYAKGRLVKVTDSSGTTEFFYDKLGREIKTRKTIDSSYYIVERTYDSIDRLKTVTYPDGEVITYEYNNAGGVETITGLSPQGTVSYITNVNYNVNGQMTRVDYGNGSYTDYNYNPQTLRLSHLITQSGAGKIQDLSYGFDNVGNVLSITDDSTAGTNTQTFGYDDLNRLTSATGESYGTMTYRYNSIGNMLQNGDMTLTYGVTAGPHAATSYTKNSITYAIDYDANGNMKSKYIDGGLKTFEYDIENRLIEVGIPKERQISDYTITLNPGWNFISIPVIPIPTQEIPTPNIPSILRYSNIPKAQISWYNSATQSWENFAYEEGKNLAEYCDFTEFEYGKGYEIYVDSPRTLRIQKGITPLTPKTLEVQAGRWNLIAAPTTTDSIPVAEALNNLIYTRVSYCDGTAYQDIDLQTGKLQSGKAYFVLLDTMSPATWNIPREQDKTTFVYDGDGGRVKRITENETVTYIGSSYEIQDAAGQKRIKKHIFMGSTRICTVEYNDGNSANSEYRYFHQDHIGSSNVITNENGQIAKLVEYTPYGLTARDAPEYNLYDTDCLYTGKLFDTSTELYYYGARYYDPELGRFIQPDTIVPYPDDPQSFNRYAYARNNPIRYVDPSGHIFGIDDLIIGIIVGAIIGGITAAVTGGNIWMGVATGAIGGALFGAVGFTGVGGLAHTIGHATAGALSGGISSVMSGGDVFQGALIGAFSAGASEWMGTNVPFLRDTGGGNFGDYLANVTRRALIGGAVGGTTSFATGGNFWQGAQYGAMTSAIAYTANDFLHGTKSMFERNSAIGNFLHGAFKTIMKFEPWDVTSWPFLDTNYGGLTKSGPGEPRSPQDAAFKVHDEVLHETGTSFLNIKNPGVAKAHLDLIRTSLEIRAGDAANIMNRNIVMPDPFAVYRKPE